MLLLILKHQTFSLHIYTTLGIDCLLNVCQELPDGGPVDRATLGTFLNTIANLAESSNETVEGIKAILRTRGTLWSIVCFANLDLDLFFSQALLIYLCTCFSLNQEANKNVVLTKFKHVSTDVLTHAQGLLQLPNHYEQDSQSFRYTFNRYEFKSAVPEQLLFLWCAMLSGHLFLLQVLYTQVIVSACTMLLIAWHVWEMCLRRAWELH